MTAATTRPCANTRIGGSEKYFDPLRGYVGRRGGAAARVGRDAVAAFVGALWAGWVAWVADGPGEAVLVVAGFVVAFCVSVDVLLAVHLFTRASRYKPRHTGSGRVA